ncbi:3-oxoacyl-ACP synthase III family protein [Actinomycetospora aeridis]|uniref:Ketoacyl-ACP synthase III n=1 Tax=Actinomycetospora aeridis TaxID=3129231 RepID=A0ABU8N0U2_9PSEU
MTTLLAGAAVHLPGELLTTAETEARIAAASDGFVPRPGMIERVTGITQRHVMPDDAQASDLAVAAVRKLLADQGRRIEDVDLLIFASASQDMVEPATAHIVAAGLGARCPVMDVKNACNSVLNAVQVAEALIDAGQYARVVVCSGETPSRATRWAIRDTAQFVEAFAGFTMCDAGAALLLERHDAGDGRGVFHRAFTADSRHWEVGTLPAGGSAYPRDPDAGHFRLDGARLRAAFEALGPGLLHDALDAHGLTWADFAVVCVHQVAMPALRVFARGAGVPADKLVVTLPEHGNAASATLPLQLVTAIEQGRAGPGDRVALVGLAGGISLGVVLVVL